MSMTKTRIWCAEKPRAALAVLAVLAALVASTACAAAAPKPVLHFESNTSGEIGLDARGVTIADVLRGLAAKGGFEVLMQEGISRPPVNLTVPMAPVEDVLHELLRGRNYALIYDGDSDALSQVIVLEPSTASPATRPVRRAPNRARGKQKGPTVVRR